ncbi:spike protein [plateatu pika coronavirus P83]|nr:spike protein [plateatu pika coronavirus P83]
MFLFLLSLTLPLAVVAFDACNVPLPVQQLNLPLAISNSTFITTAVFPTRQWYCSVSSNASGSANKFNGLGVFVNRFTVNNWWHLAVYPQVPTNKTWILFWFHAVSGRTTFQVCKYPQASVDVLISGFRCDGNIAVVCPAIVQSALECLVNVTFVPSSFSFSYITWYNGEINAVLHNNHFEFVYDGFMWSNVSAFCYDGGGCSFNIPTTVSEWLVQTDAAGVVQNYVDCAFDYESQLKCKNQVFELTPAVYQGASVDLDSALYYIANELPDCGFSFSDLFLDGTGNYAGLRRHVFTNCWVNYTSWFACTDNSICSVFNAIFAEVRYNLTQPDGLVNPFIKCNGLDVYSITKGCSSGYILRYQLFPEGRFEVDSYTPDYMECFGYFNLYNGYIIYNAKFITSGLTVCVVQPAIPVVGVCKSYTIDGVTFQGILHNSNASIATFHNLLYYGDMVSYVRIRGIVYRVEPCNSFYYSVFKTISNIGYLYSGSKCNSTDVTTFSKRVRATTFVDSTLGCFVDVSVTNLNYSDCTNPIGNGLCVDLNVTGLPVVGNIYIQPHDTDYARPILTAQQIELPLDHYVAVKEQFVQTSAPKFDVDCERYICDVSVQCKELLAKYGGYCAKVLADIRSASTELDYQILGIYKTLSVDVRVPDVDFGAFNFSMYQSDGNRRSFIEDLLFDKIETSGPGFYQDYYNCKQINAQDITCKQYYNGIMVIPPIMDDDTITMWSAFVTASMTAGMFGGQAGMVSWSIALAGRLNALGVMQDALVSDVNKLANGFNNLTQYVADGFKTTSQALSAIQNVVNNNAQQVSQLVQGLSENFGAISNNFVLIAERLERIEAMLQMDRLINGRMNILQNFVTNYKLSVSELKAQQVLAQNLINECVYAQSSRNGFCGDGLHLFTIMQRAPDGIMFLHHTLLPNNTIIVETTPGLCFSNNVCVAPKDGIFVRDITRSDMWYFSTRNLYSPQALSVNNTMVVSGGVNYTSVNFTVPDIVPPANPSFDAEFAELYKNISLELEQLKNISFDPEFLNLTYYIDRLDELAVNISQLQVNVTEFNKFVRYVKWPWYVWLLIFLIIVLLSFLLLWCCCATGCCGCCGFCSSMCDGCCDKTQPIEFEKVHIS